MGKTRFIQIMIFETVGLQAYADDIAIIENNVEEIKSSCRQLIKTAGKVDLQINDEKTKYIIMNRR